MYLQLYRLSILRPVQACNCSLSDESGARLGSGAGPAMEAYSCPLSAVDTFAILHLGCPLRRIFPSEQFRLQIKGGNQFTRWAGRASVRENLPVSKFLEMNAYTSFKALEAKRKVRRLKTLERIFPNQLTSDWSSPQESSGHCAIARWWHRA